MSDHKYKINQLLYFLEDPDIEDGEYDINILCARVERITRNSVYEDVYVFSSGKYDRTEEDCYATLEEAAEYVDHVFSSMLQAAKEDVAQCRRELKLASSDLSKIKQRIRRWHNRGTKYN